MMERKNVGLKVDMGLCCHGGKPNKVIYLQGKGKWPQQTPLKDAQDPGPAGLCRGCTEQGALAPPGHRHLPEATTTQPRSLWGEHTA